MASPVFCAHPVEFQVWLPNQLDSCVVVHFWPSWATHVNKSINIIYYFPRVCGCARSVYTTSTHPQHTKDDDHPNGCDPSTSKLVWPLSWRLFSIKITRLRVVSVFKWCALCFRNISTPLALCIETSSPRTFFSRMEMCSNSRTSVWPPSFGTRARNANWNAPVEPCPTWPRNSSLRAPIKPNPVTFGVAALSLWPCLSGVSWSNTLFGDNNNNILSLRVLACLLAKSLLGFWEPCSS